MRAFTLFQKVVDYESISHKAFPVKSSSLSLSLYFQLGGANEMANVGDNGCQKKPHDTG